MYRQTYWFPVQDSVTAVFFVSAIAFVIFCVGYALNLALPVLYTWLMWLSLGSSGLLLAGWWTNRPARAVCWWFSQGDETFLNRFSFADKLGSFFVPILLGGFSKTAIMSWWVIFCILACFSGRIPVNKFGKPEIAFGDVDGSPRSSIAAAPHVVLLTGWSFFTFAAIVWLGLAFLLQAIFKSKPNDYSYVLLGQWALMLLVVTIAEMIAGHVRRIRIVWVYSIAEREELAREELMKEGIAAPAPEIVQERISQRWNIPGDQHLPFGFILNFAATAHGIADLTFQVLGMAATWPVMMVAALARVSAAKAQERELEESRQRQNAAARRFGT